MFEDKYNLATSFKQSFAQKDSPKKHQLKQYKLTSNCLDIKIKTNFFFVFILELSAYLNNPLENTFFISIVGTGCIFLFLGLSRLVQFNLYYFL